MMIPRTVISGIASAGIAAALVLGGQLPAVAGNLPAAQHGRAAGSGAQIELMHIHGLSYRVGGKKIVIPSHNGMTVYSNGGWSKMAGLESDFMGFAATRDAFYSSRHPAPGSGQTWQKLGMEGESDFHMLGTGYETGAIYLVHPTNTKTVAAAAEDGLYLSRDAGTRFEKSLMAKWQVC